MTDPIVISTPVDGLTYCQIWSEYGAHMGSLWLEDNEVVDYESGSVYDGVRVIRLALNHLRATEGIKDFKVRVGLGPRSFWVSLGFNISREQDYLWYHLS